MAIVAIGGAIGGAIRPVDMPANGVITSVWHVPVRASTLPPMVGFGTILACEKQKLNHSSRLKSRGSDRFSKCSHRIHWNFTSMLEVSPLTLSETVNIGKERKERRFSLPSSSHDFCHCHAHASACRCMDQLADLQHLGHQLLHDTTLSLMQTSSFYFSNIPYKARGVAQAYVKH